MSIKSRTRTLGLRGGAHHDLQLAGVLRGLVDGLVEVELVVGAFADERAELAQGDLDLAHVEHEVGAIGPIDARVGDGHRAARPPPLGPDAHARGVRALARRTGWCRRCRSSGCRRRAALSARASAPRRAGGARSKSRRSKQRALLRRELLARLGSSQPLVELLREIEREARLLDAAEVRGEGLVEGVEVAPRCGRRARGPRGRSRRASCRGGP